MPLPDQSSHNAGPQAEPRLRLGIISGTTAYRSPAGTIWINHSIGRLCEALRDRFPDCRICLPIVPHHLPNLNHVLNFPADDITVLPPLATTIKAQRYIRSTRDVLRKFADDIDLLFIRLPFQIPRTLLGLNKPKLLHVVSNPLEVVRASKDYGGPMKWLARMFAAHSNRSMHRLASEPQTRICTNGEEMWQLLQCRAGRVVVSSCLLRSEIHPKEKFELNQPPRLLFVGYLRPEKGVDTLLDAFAAVRRQRPLSLTLVGGSDRTTSAEADIRRRVREHPFSSDISLVGMLPFGDRLFDIYRSHDLLIHPSLSEGTPRTLVEARAFGCPVIATRVGGIPDSVVDGIDGLLVPPQRPDELAAAIIKLLDDETLRHKLIRAGLARSNESTVEHFADVLSEELMEAWRSSK
jgi:glycosyltransferase involved in cell wall biosynthesis